MRFSKGKCKVLLAPNATPQAPIYMLRRATRWKTALQKRTPRWTWARNVPLRYKKAYDGCIRKSVTSRLWEVMPPLCLALVKATLGLCEQWGWLRWPPELEPWSLRILDYLCWQALTPRKPLLLIWGCGEGFQNWMIELRLEVCRLNRSV